MKALVLAYDFPPLISIGGQRPYSWLRYLPANGIETTVITRQWNETINSPIDYVKPSPGSETEIEKTATGTVYRTSFKPNLRDSLLLKFGINKFSVLRKLLTYVLGYLEFLSLPFDAKRNIYKEARKFLQNNKADVIIATGEPFILFKYASALSAEFNIPWVADYRDGWTNNQGGYRNNILYRLQAMFYKNREQKYMRNVSVITTPAPLYAHDLKTIHPTKQVKVCYNGYNDEAFENVILPPADKYVFNIAYAGTLYPYQKLEVFLDGLSDFLAKRKDVNDLKLTFYGALHNNELKDRALNYAPHLTTYMQFTPRIPYAQAMQQMGKAHILLLLTAKSVNSLATKVFDYLALKREILLVENDEVMEGIIKQANAGRAFSTASEVSSFIAQKYDDFKAGKSAENNTINYQFYSRKVQAEKFADILKGIMKHTA